MPLVMATRVSEGLTLVIIVTLSSALTAVAVLDNAKPEMGAAARSLASASHVSPLAPVPPPRAFGRGASCAFQNNIRRFRTQQPPHSLRQQQPLSALGLSGGGMSAPAPVTWVSPPPPKISTVAEMTALDHGCTDQYGVPSALLMESAGLASFRLMREKYQVGPGSRVLVFAGPGNNGGDGFVVARHALAAGASVKVLLMAKPETYKPDAKTNYEAAVKLGIPIIDFHSGELSEALSDLLTWANFAVDAIFGVGLARDVRGKYAEVVHNLNAWKNGPVLALDIPSGVGGDRGDVKGVAVKATATITYGVPKLGNLLYPGYSLGGELFTTRIGFPPHHDAGVQVELARPSGLLKPRDAQGHKTSFGQALFVAGARTYFGAPLLASLSFMKAGGGYSRLAAPMSVIPYVAVNAPGVVYLPMPETSSGTISSGAVEEILKIAKSQSCVVIGPGLSLEPETQSMILSVLPVLEREGIPMVIDGDALTALATSYPLPASAASSSSGSDMKQQPLRILTPHLGEMSRLLGGRPVSDIKANLVDSARECAVKYGAIVVAKGPHSLTVAPWGAIKINPTGNSGMGTAGSGDVLCGLIAAMVGYGLPLFDATYTAVFLHGMAGDIAAMRLGEDGMTSADLMEAAPEAMRWLRDPSLIPSPLFRRYMGPEVV